LETKFLLHAFQVPCFEPEHSTCQTSVSVQDH
jgi:hypothetical protein